MASHSIGKVFVELDLDTESYTKKQKKLVKDATSTSLVLEDNFKKLGIKAAQEMDLMRQKITNGYTAIANSAKASKDEILRAEKAKNEQLKKLDIEQHGERISLIDKFKAHWVGVTAAIYVAWKAVSGAIRFVGGIIKEITLAAGRYETLGVAMRVVGNNAGYTGEQMDNFAKGLQKQNIAMTESRQVLTMMVEAQMDLNNLNRLARIAQHATVIGNINSSEAMQQMIWGIQSANIRVLRTIGINVSFEASYQKMAAALNKAGSAVKRTAENLTELEKVTARTGAVMDFEEKLKGTYEASMETAQKQLLSLKRHFDNLKVLAGTVFTPLLLEGVQFVTGAGGGL